MWAQWRMAPAGLTVRSTVMTQGSVVCRKPAGLGQGMCFLTVLPVGHGSQEPLVFE